jgi:hypothetical protein
LRLNIRVGVRDTFIVRLFNNFQGFLGRYSDPASGFLLAARNHLFCLSLLLSA